MIVQVKQGLLEGFTKKSILTGKEYCAFLGIPYAKPPVGELRFQPPQPIEKWNGTLSAKTEGSPCIQKDFSGEYIGGEDCLYLNVYTPNLPGKNDAPRAVMVFIHGGGFLYGTGSNKLYSPDYLINYDVILVTLNYRLHVLGFLNMGTKNNAGNCGLRDQCLALKWVNENVKEFGGDPKNITIFGESAGASSVYYHLISPMSKGLFTKAIVQSDPAVCQYDESNDVQKLGFELAKKLGSDEKDPEKLVEFLRKQSALDLYKNIPNIFQSNMEQKDGEAKSNFFKPAPEIVKDNAFLPDTFQNLIKTATPVPLIIGLNNKEGRMAFSIIDENLLEVLKNDFTKVIKRPSNFSSSEFHILCDKIKKHYLGDEPVGEETAEKIVDLYTDYWFRHFYALIDFITNSNAPVYMYQFSFHGKFNVFEKLLAKNRPASSSGACHADELPYLFYPQIFLPEVKTFSEPEVTVIKNMCSLWTNFAKYVNPTENFENIKWRRFSSSNPCFMSIDKDLQLVEEKLRGKEFEFWLKLIE